MHLKMEVDQPLMELRYVIWSAVAIVARFAEAPTGWMCISIVAEVLLHPYTPSKRLSTIPTSSAK